MTVLLSIFAFGVIAIAIFLVAAFLWTRQLAKPAKTIVPQAGYLHPVRGGAIHFVDLGPPDAQPLVLIHGLGGQMQHFTYALTDFLSDTFRVIVVDRPGCGYSERDSDAMADPSEQARMIGEFLDAKDITNPVLVGHSLGGAVSLAMALQRPDNVAGLALICPLTHPQPAAPEMFKGLEVQSPTLRRLIGNTLAVPIANSTAEKVLAAVFKPEQPVPDFMDRGGAALGMRPQGFVSASGDMVAVDHAIEGQAARYGSELKVPGGVLFGADDAVLSPDTEGKTMEQYGLTFETLPGRGHMIPLTAPQECADFIRRIAARV